MTFIVRLIRRSFIFLLLIGLLIGGCVWLLLRGSLPQYTGEARIPGLTTTVTLERDSLGTATIHAQNQLDLVRAMGFVHAQERFFEMDLMRRRAAGELAELFGSAALPADRIARRYRMRARVSDILNQLSRDDYEILKTYQQGVNDGLRMLNVRPFPYLLTQSQPDDWKMEDSLLVVMAMYFMLNDLSKYRELGLSTMKASLPDSVYHFLTTNGGQWEAPLLGKPSAWPLQPTADEIDLQILDPELLHNNYVQNGNMPGSNSFAVAGALTNGAALVANDMHLELKVPNTWFRTRLIYPDSENNDKTHDITGVSLPGMPAIIVGSNRHIAWSFTNSYGDFADWIRVTTDPQNPSRYLSSTGWKSFVTHHETIRIKDEKDESLIVNETEWGPILAEDYDGTPLALAWTALQPHAINLKLRELGQTTSIDEAIVIAQSSGVPAQNFVVGDKNGRIAWTIAGLIPQRSLNYDPTIPTDWSTANTGWQGWLEASHYPLIIDPLSHRLWTANSRIIANLSPDLIGDGGYDIGARTKQIRDNLYEREQFTAADMMTIQLDHRALFLARWHRLLESTLSQSPNESSWHHEMHRVLADWDGHASPESVSYRVVRTFRQAVIQRVIDGFAIAIRQKHPEFEMPRLNHIENAVWQLIEQQPPHLLSPSFDTWDALLNDSAAHVINTLQKQPDGLTARNWGEHNTASIRHPLSRLLPDFIAGWLDMPADPLPGDANMPRIQSSNFGASLRSAVSPGNEEEGYFDMPGGQSGHPLSPYYGSGHTHWVNEVPTPFLPGPAEHVLQLLPPC